VTKAILKFCFGVDLWVFSRLGVSKAQGFICPSLAHCGALALGASSGTCMRSLYAKFQISIASNMIEEMDDACGGFCSFAHILHFDILLPHCQIKGK